MLTDATTLVARARRLSGPMSGSMSGPMSTDDILPARYKHMYTDPADLAPHVFENILPGWAATVRPGDAIVSSDIFGIGSSREQAVSALLAAGIQAVFAPRFGRIFFRNAWNLGLCAIELVCPFAEGSEVTLDLAAGVVRDTATTLTFAAPPPRMIELYRSGGLLALLAYRDHVGAR
jgi:3-isopropylmalate/(R)-2-methylmalate dehydratase small subunit